MKVCFRIKDVETGEFIKDYDQVMDDSGIDSRMRFEAIGVQDDGTAVIFDKCGNFGYIAGKYELVIMSDV